MEKADRGWQVLSGIVQGSQQPSMESHGPIVENFLPVASP